jgi:hypothetical protein
MKNSDWPPAEVQKTAGSSGKPLEVQCALAFLRRGEWAANLSSYFEDPASGIPRELDVLADRWERLGNEGGGVSVICRLRALVSCKGFPPAHSPMAYSVSRECVPPFEEAVLYENSEAGAGTADAVSKGAGEKLLEVSGLTAARPLIAFDVIEREEREKKGKGKAGTDPPFVAFRSRPNGDRPLYEGFDSALKATFYWAQGDSLNLRLTPEKHRQIHLALYVPILVTSVPFWEVPIDDGIVGTPFVSRRGFQTMRYPTPTPSRESRNRDVTTLIWTADDLPALVEALDKLFEWFRSEIRALGNPFRGSTSR